MALTRSQIMSRVGQRDTAPELRLRLALYATGVRYRVNLRVEGIKADIVHPRSRVAIFVDGCFWHGCPMHATRPATNQAYWLPKLDANRERDLRQTKRLSDAGWKVIRVWEHDCRSPTTELVSSLAAACGVVSPASKKA